LQQQQQQQHINKEEEDLETEITTSEGSEKELNLEDKNFILITFNIYMPQNREGIGTLLFVGCLRVIEPFLSPHRYK